MGFSLQDDKIYLDWLKTAPRKFNAGLTIIGKFKDRPVIIMGSNTTHKGLEKYELLGGQYDDADKTALHTAVREFTEEFFNKKYPQELINNICKNLIIHNKLLDLTIIFKSSISYFINLKTFEQIYNLINNNVWGNIPLDLNKIIKKRNKLLINLKKPHNGLNEIETIHVVYLDKVLELNMRLFTLTIINKLKSSLKLH
jgi:hypothetical protein